MFLLWIHTRTQRQRTDGAQVLKVLDNIAKEVFLMVYRLLVAFFFF